MKNVCISILILSIGFIGLSSCGSDDADDVVTCSIAFGTELQSEVNDFVNAGAAYGNDPSQANCDAYKAAFQAYINALKPYGNCAALTGQNRIDFNNALNEAENNLATIC